MITIQCSLFLSRQQRAASSTDPQRRRNKRRRRRRRRRRPAVGRQPPKGEGRRPARMLWRIDAGATWPSSDLAKYSKAKKCLRQRMVDFLELQNVFWENFSQLKDCKCSSRWMNNVRRKLPFIFLTNINCQKIYQWRKTLSFIKISVSCLDSEWCDLCMSIPDMWAAAALNDRWQGMNRRRHGCPDTVHCAVPHTDINPPFSLQFCVFQLACILVKWFLQSTELIPDLTTRCAIVHYCSIMQSL